MAEQQRSSGANTQTHEEDTMDDDSISSQIAKSVEWIFIRSPILLALYAFNFDLLDLAEMEDEAPRR